MPKLGVEFCPNNSKFLITCKNCGEPATLRANCHINLEASIPCCEKEECKEVAAADAIEVASSKLIPIV